MHDIFTMFDIRVFTVFIFTKMHNSYDKSKSKNLWQPFVTVKSFRFFEIVVIFYSSWNSICIRNEFQFEYAVENYCFFESYCFLKSTVYLKFTVFWKVLFFENYYFLKITVFWKLLLFWKELFFENCCFWIFFEKYC